MTNRIRFVVATVAVALFLGACSVTVFIGALVDETVDAVVYTGADLTATSSVDFATLGRSDEKVYRVRIASSSNDAVYVYLDADLELYVYDSEGRRYASSSSRDYFATGDTGIASVSGAALAPADVGFDIACPGSCVILPATFDDELFLRVVNGGSSDASFNLWTVLRDFEDSGEASSSPVPIPSAASAESATGALETLGDVDIFVAQDTGVLFFDGVPDSGIIYEARIDPADPLLDPIFLSSGESDLVLAGETVTVYAVNANARAAASGFSKYFLDIDD